MPLSDRARRLIVPLTAFFLGVAMLGATLLVTLAPSGRNLASSAVGGPFTLVSHEGRVVTERDFAGQPYLVFFGYTHCPDVCPTTLFQISEVLRATGGRGKDLRALFITVDPERDTPEALKSYLGSFDERIVGLTGDRAAVEAAIKGFRAYSRKVPTEDGDYAMEHTALVYQMDSQGRFVRSFNVNRPADDAARDLLSQV